MKKLSDFSELDDPPTPLLCVARQLACLGYAEVTVSSTGGEEKCLQDLGWDA